MKPVSLWSWVGGIVRLPAIINAVTSAVSDRPAVHINRRLYNNKKADENPSAKNKRERETGLEHKNLNCSCEEFYVWFSCDVAIIPEKVNKAEY